MYICQNMYIYIYMYRADYWENLNGLCNESSWKGERVSSFFREIERESALFLSQSWLSLYLSATNHRGNRADSLSISLSLSLSHTHTHAHRLLRHSLGTHYRIYIYAWYICMCVELTIEKFAWLLAAIELTIEAFSGQPQRIYVSELYLYISMIYIYVLSWILRNNGALCNDRADYWDIL